MLHSSDGCARAGKIAASNAASIAMEPFTHPLI